MNLKWPLYEDIFFRSWRGAVISGCLWSFYYLLLVSRGGREPKNERQFQLMLQFCCSLG